MSLLRDLLNVSAIDAAKRAAEWLGIRDGGFTPRRTITRSRPIVSCQENGEAAARAYFAAERARFGSLPPLEDDMPAAGYLQRKKIPLTWLGGLDLRSAHDRSGPHLRYPLRNARGETVGLHRVYPDGGKRLVQGSQLRGAFAEIKGKPDAVLIGEGLATLASACRATGLYGIVATSANNLRPVAEAVRAIWGADAELIILVDDDAAAENPKKGNPGLLAALEAAAAVGAKIALPKLDGPGDFDDLRRQRCLAAVAERIRKARRTPKCPAQLALDLLKAAPRPQVGRYARQAIDVMLRANWLPLKRTPEEAAGEIVAAVPPDWLDAAEVRRWIVKRLDREQQRAAAPLEITDTAKVELHRVRSLDGVADLIDARGPCVVLLRAPMGAGKTQHVLAPLAQRAASRGRLPVAIAPLRSLTGQLAEKTGLPDYRVVKAADMSDTEGLACCINSLPRDKFGPVVDFSRWLAVDEARQVLEAISGGTVEDRPAVHALLGRQIERAEVAILADALLDQQVVDFAREHSGGKPVLLIDMPPAQGQFTLEVTTEPAAVYDEITIALERGGRVIVPTDSAREAKSIQEAIQAKVPKKRVLVITAKEDGETDARAFLDDPDRQALRWDAIIYSPAVQSGMSLTVPGFDLVAGIYTGSITPANFCQMLRRYRPASRALVSVTARTERREEDPVEILRGLLDSEIVQYDPERRELHQPVSDFDDFRAQMMARENAERNCGGAGLYYVARFLGFDVRRFDGATVAGKAEGKALRALGRELAEAEYQQTVMSAPDLCDEEAAEIEKADRQTAADSAKLERHRIRRGLAVQEPGLDDLLFYARGRGLAALRRYEEATATEAAALAFDARERASGAPLSLRRNVTARLAIWRGVSQRLGIELATGAGEFTASEASEALAWLLQRRAQANVMGVGPHLGPKGHREPVKWVTVALRRLGLAVTCERRREPTGQGRAAPVRRFYRVELHSLELVRHYAQQRADAGANPLARSWQPSPGEVAAAGFQVRTHAKATAPKPRMEGRVTRHEIAEKNRIISELPNKSLELSVTRYESAALYNKNTPRRGTVEPGEWPSFEDCLNLLAIGPGSTPRRPIPPRHGSFRRPGIAGNSNPGVELATGKNWGSHLESGSHSREFQ